MAEKEGYLEPIIPATVEQVSAEQRHEMEVIMASYSSSGPIPSPSMMAMYEEVLPGCAHRLVLQMEAQGDHRRAMETRHSQAAVFRLKFGQVSALTIGLVAIVGGLFLVYAGKSISGFATFFTALASLVGLFFWGRAQEVRSKAIDDEENAPPPASAPTRKKKPRRRKK